MNRDGKPNGEGFAGLRYLLAPQSAIDLDNPLKKFLEGKNMDAIDKQAFKILASIGKLHDI